ncbi:unnamed protein product, partial [Effrenium voratum]
RCGFCWEGGVRPTEPIAQPCEPRAGLMAEPAEAPETSVVAMKNIMMKVPPTCTATLDVNVHLRWRQPMEAVMRRILKDYQGQAEIRDGMESGMRRLFENPYRKELGALLGRDKLPLEEAQRIVFFPRLSDMEVYVTAFKLDTPVATKRKEQLMKFKLLSVFYTLHRLDGGLMERFMHFGGLGALVSLLGEERGLGEENRVIQSQAMELLTDFLEPQMQMLQPAAGRQAHLQHQIFHCLRSAAFWQNLSQILLEPGEVFPRSFASSIRLMAGSIGWLAGVQVQAPETAEAKLEVQNAAAAVQQVMPKLQPELRGLAEDLIEELSRVPAIRSDPLCGEALEKVRRSIFNEAAQQREDAAHAWQALKLLGNEAFGAGQLWPAEAIYRLALEEGESVLPDPEASVLASNRALVLLKAGHFAEAAAAAARALQWDLRNAKAAFRQAQALLELGSDPSAALLAAQKAAELAPSDAKVAELLQRAHAACPATTSSLDGLD